MRGGGGGGGWGDGTGGRGQYTVARLSNDTNGLQQRRTRATESMNWSLKDVRKIPEARHVLCLLDGLHLRCFYDAFCISLPYMHHDIYTHGACIALKGDVCMIMQMAHTSRYVSRRFSQPAVSNGLEFLFPHRVNSHHGDYAYIAVIQYAVQYVLLRTSTKTNSSLSWISLFEKRYR